MPNIETSKLSNLSRGDHNDTFQNEFVSFRHSGLGKTR